LIDAVTLRAARAAVLNIASFTRAGRAVMLMFMLPQSMVIVPW
jgi:hypothetical protein